MSGMEDAVQAARYRAFAGARGAAGRCLVVDVAGQRLGLLVDGEAVADWPVSTASAGIGGEDGSYRTPPGWHRIHACIGEGADPLAVFRARVATGEVWDGAPGGGDLILGRVLTLDGEEPGVNRGPGVDSLERTIYIHGTNHPEDLGRPASHGCVRMAPADVLDLFRRVEAGDPVLVAVGSAGRLHFTGVGGSGMSALAQFMAWSGHEVSGSDRGFDQGLNPEGRARLEAAGIRILPQDGAGVAADCLGVVVSTAVEDTVPDVREARRLGVPVLHRSECLAHLVASRRTLAITGTSGKSTAVAMAFEILAGAGWDPAVVTGGDLLALRDRGLWGNAWAGAGPLVIEADESDGSLVRYRPAVGVVMNLQRDHKEMAEVAALFRTFRGRVRETFRAGDGPGLEGLARDGERFGLGPGPGLRALGAAAGPAGCAFTVEGVPFTLPVPGLHNVEDALAAIAGCRALGVPLADMVAPLAAFRGVARRFQVVGCDRGVEVVDDFAHNPAKVTAALRAARARAARVLAVFQPHGYGPMRFLRADFTRAFAGELGPGGILWMLPIFYAGGTVTRDISSEDVAADIRALGADARPAPDRPWLAEAIAAEAREGDLVLVMGARDPSLSAFAESALRSLRARP
ncbi:L,D-transpeptidase family protein [Mesoterricola sediminis]|uniref:L,D-TPase catalytic domain-containing protein n=1 Tax=Mesoterricola sediminis TaxID=2927980 RepID=A0AA48KBZ6_9BACT|nr:L,D-transpeptidase family protein [Mesoterricola sediminis]BDU76624.1 hypothetical protein METESE_15820 [Mesoterricola sediminis]